MMDISPLLQALQQIHQRNGQQPGAPNLQPAQAPAQPMPPASAPSNSPSIMSMLGNAMGPGGAGGALQAASNGGLPALNNYAAANTADATASNFAAPAAKADGLSGIMSLLSSFL